MLEKLLLTPFLMESESFIRFSDHLLSHTDRPQSPLLVGWSITDRCQLNCRHCWANKYASTGLSLADKLAIAHKLAQSSIYRVVLTGGEPTCDPHLPDILRCFLEQEKPVALYTNGILGKSPTLHEHWDFSSSYVQVSIDGGTLEQYERQRGKGNFVKLLRGLDYLKSHGFRVLAHFVATPENDSDLYSAAQLAQRYGCEVFIAEMYYPHGKALDYGVEQRILTARRFNAHAERLQSDQELVNGPMKIGLCLPICAALPQVPIPEAKPHAAVPLSTGRYSFLIASDGSVYPHMTLTTEEYHCGSLLDSSVEEIWRDGSGFRKLPSYRDLTQTRCASCADYAFCRGGLEERAFLYTGDFSQPDPWCHKLKRQID